VETIQSFVTDYGTGPLPGTGGDYGNGNIEGRDWGMEANSKGRYIGKIGFSTMNDVSPLKAGEIYG